VLSDVGVLNVGDWVVVAPIGELDLAALPRLRQEVVGLVSGGSRKVVLDLAAVDFVDSAGLGGVVAVAKRVLAHGGMFRVARAEPRVWEVFTLVGLNRIFTCHDDLDAAMADGDAHGGTGGSQGG
jgi:anti-sigma B factor antagonist